MKINKKFITIGGTLAFGAVVASVAFTGVGAANAAASWGGGSKPDTITIHKVDSVTGLPLAGATFRVEGNVAPVSVLNQQEVVDYLSAKEAYDTYRATNPPAGDLTEVELYNAYRAANGIARPFLMGSTSVEVTTDMNGDASFVAYAAVQSCSDPGVLLSAAGLSVAGYFSELHSITEVTAPSGYALPTTPTAPTWNDVTTVLPGMMDCKSTGASYVLNVTNAKEASPLVPVVPQQAETVVKATGVHK